MSEATAAAPPSAAAPQDASAAYRKHRRLVPYAVGASLLTLAAISLWYNLRRGQDLGTGLRSLNLWAVPAALGLHLLMQCFWGMRIWTLGGGLGAPIPYPRAVALVTSGLFAAAVTPGRVGGEPWRIALLVRGGASGAAASRTILADRAVDMLYFLALGIVAVASLPLLFGGDTGNVRALGAVAVFGLAAIVLLVALILASPRAVSRLFAWAAALPARARGREPPDRQRAIAAFFQEVRDGLGLLVRTQPLRLVAAALLSLALWTCELSILWVVLRGFGFHAAYPAVYAAGILVVMIASVPLLPGGTGLAEVAALTLLTPLAPGLSPAFLLVWRGLTYYMDLLAGGIVAGWVVKRRAASPSGTQPSAGAPP